MSHCCQSQNSGGAPVGSLLWESVLPLWGTSLHYHLPFLTSMGSSLCPTGDSASPVPKRVGLLHISRVLSEVFGDRLAGGSQGAQDTFPLQQKVLLCSLLLLARHSHARDVTLGKVSVSGTLSGLDLGTGWVSLGCLLGALLCFNPPCLPQLHDTYSQVCRRQQLPAIDQAECLSLVTLLESRGVLELKRAKEARLAKVLWGGGAGFGDTAGIQWRDWGRIW